MHELSIAHDLVERASAAAQQAGARRVTAVHLDLGALSGVVKDALLFGYDIAAQGTLLEGSQLVVRDVPVVVYCANCGREYELAGVHDFHCPACARPCPDVRQGKQVQLVSLEIEGDE